MTRPRCTREQGLRQLYAETRALELHTSATRFNINVSEAARQMLIRQVEELGDKAREVAWRLRFPEQPVPAALPELAGLSTVAGGQTSIDSLARARETVTTPTRHRHGTARQVPDEKESGGESTSSRRD